MNGKDNYSNLLVAIYMTFLLFSQPVACFMHLFFLKVS